MSKKYFELLEVIKSTNNDQNLSVRNGYLWGGHQFFLGFEKFVRPEKIGYKFPKPNLSDIEIDAFSSFLKLKHKDFTHRLYNTQETNEKNSDRFYSIWEIDCSVNNTLCNAPVSDQI